MSTEPLRLERRAGQRFDFQMPVSVRMAGSGLTGCGVTHDLSARGVSLFTDLVMNEGDAVELTMMMPSEITLTENMRVCCRGKVLRVIPSVVPGKLGIAVRLEGYEFLPEATEFPAIIDRSTAAHLPQEHV